jgi:hypothetical protein
MARGERVRNQNICTQKCASSRNARATNNPWSSQKRFYNARRGGSGFAHYFAPEDFDVHAARRAVTLDVTLEMQQRGPVRACCGDRAQAARWVREQARCRCVCFGYSATMPALPGSRRALLQVISLTLAVLAVCACGSPEATPLGSPSYLPPDPGGAAGTAGTAGNGGTAGGAGGANANGGLGGLP